MWINACDGLDDLKAQISEMLAASPEDFAEEYAIQDYEGFGSYALSEYGALKPVSCWIVLAVTWKKQKQPPKANIAAAINHWLITPELTEETTQIPENLTYYIDYEHMGRDMEMSGDVFTIATGYEELHIFWNH